MLSRMRGGAASSGSSITLSATGSSVSVVQGNINTIAVSLSRTGFTGTVSLAVAGLPTGVTGSFSPATLTGATLTSTLTLTAALSAPTITSDAFTITASGSGVSDSVVDYVVTVTASSGTATWLANLPSGLTLLKDVPLADTLAEGISVNDYDSAYSIVSDGTAPAASTCANIAYPAGSYGNGGTGAELYWDMPAGGRREIYVAFWIKFSSNYRVHSNEEKLFYPLIYSVDSRFLKHGPRTFAPVTPHRKARRYSRVTGVVISG